ncbi:hypothetical protein SAMN06265379_102121 [Saccharicrinis carchari]|uniref:Amidinotransferase n=1 Tax=Saccharicrinis carchari TaxID=1168039 RepID=A0A521BVG0_SACCC|nr:arginine deiminase-related protein [Saccharicrinis carchari]SMO51158.1 hypothetical protein SAMN06265379_102121 [Saccharicrinis carchari]
MKQSTSHILMVRPARFNYNAQTAESNAFQNKVDLSAKLVHDKAVLEFDHFAEQLKARGVNLTIVEDTLEPTKPDAVFPNNWASFHADGTVILYPVAAPNRRLEKRPEILEQIKEDFVVSKVIDLSKYENEEKYLEGTGSVVYDHINKIAYAGLSLRTHKEVVHALCKIIDYTPVIFTATDEFGQEIYHTNVMMCVSEHFAVVCLQSIKNKEERDTVIKSLEQSGHEIIEVSLEQVVHFAGNMLSVLTQDGSELLVMSESAFNALSDTQRQTLENFCEPFPLPINTIETVGGGSARCMMAEIFLTESD